MVECIKKKSVKKDFARNENETVDPQLLQPDIDDVYPSAFNARRDFEESALRELAESITEHGLLEPIVVRPRAHPAGGWEIIAGERRWRACKLAGMRRIQVVARNIDDKGALILSLVENLLRKDINPIEEAAGFQALRDMGFMVQEIAQKINKAQSTISNSIRLLDLPEDVLELIRDDKISQSHGRALLPFVHNAELIGVLATAAAGISSKELEKIDLFDSKTREFVRSLESYSARFSPEAEGCGTCAYKHKRYCTRPECFDEKRQAFITKQEDAAAAIFAEVGADGVVDLDVLSYSDYYGDYNTVRDDYPGCPGDCPKIQVAKKHDAIVKVCFDVTCWEMMRDARRSAENDVAQTTMQNKISGMIAAMSQPGAIKKLNAIAVHGSIAFLNLRCNANILLETARRMRIDLDFTERLIKHASSSYHEINKLMEILSELPAEQLLVLIAETFMRIELTRGWGTPIITDWFIGAEKDGKTNENQN